MAFLVARTAAKLMDLIDIPCQYRWTLQLTEARRTDFAMIGFTPVSTVFLATRVAFSASAQVDRFPTGTVPDDLWTVAIAVAEERYEIRDAANLGG